MSGKSADGVQQIERKLGVSDIDSRELDRMCDRIRHVVKRDLDVSVQSIYVMGSFARGEARPVVSDIDVRVVVQGMADEEAIDECEYQLKCEHGPDIVPSVCGYLDPHITILRPDGRDPHVEVL